MNLEQLMAEIINDETDSEPGDCSNMQLYNYIVYTFGVEDISLDAYYNFNKAFLGGFDVKDLMACYFLAVLQRKFYMLCQLTYVLPGDEADGCYHYCLYWEMRFKDLIASLECGEEISHKWLH